MDTIDTSRLMGIDQTNYHTQHGQYPSSQVARLIHDRGEGQDNVDGDRRTPVDLQEIVEKLNNAIKDCRVKNNLKLDELSPIHEKNKS